MVRSTRGVGVHPLAQESQVLHCRDAHSTEVLYSNLQILKTQTIVTITSICNADVSDGSACKVFSWSFKLK